jgi:glutaredoxin
MNEYTREELEAEYISTARDNAELDKKLEECMVELEPHRYLFNENRINKINKYKSMISGGKTRKRKRKRKTRRRKKPKKITIVGYPSCDYYIKARRAAKAFFGVSNVTDIKFSTKLKYKNWLKKKDGIKFSSKAKSHKTCPFVWTNNKKYVGGCDDTLVLIKKLKCKTKKKALQN